MEERLNELEKRIAKLERKEKRRTLVAIIKFAITLILIGLICYYGYRFYTKINETLIKPYNELLEKYNKADDTISSIKDLFK